MPTYYEILGLPETLHDEPLLPVQTLRNAYRRALLQNHPDKIRTPHSSNQMNRFSIDQISNAYTTLSNSTSRANYHKDLKLQQAAADSDGHNGAQVFKTGIESVDLDDLTIDEAEGTWYRSCRCGDERGFSVQEADLEEAADEGEVSVGCRGCSLWLKVLFKVVDDVGQEQTTAAHAA